jgi:hypothetical protein
LAEPSGRVTPAACTAACHRASIAAIAWRLAIMPNITMLDIEELRKTKLKPYIDKCLEHRAPDPGFHAMMGHNIDLCEAMFVAWDACFNKGRIPHPLKEVIRVQLSRAASCTY